MARSVARASGLESVYAPPGFRRSMRARKAILTLALLAGGCPSFGPSHPPRPPLVRAAPTSDPMPPHVYAHVALTPLGLQPALYDALPQRGDGSFAMLRTQRMYTWDRSPVEVAFAQGRVV